MELKQYQEALFEKAEKGTITSRRQELVKEILDLINAEREHTRYKPITARAVAIKVAHLKEQDLQYMISVGKDYQSRHGSFSKYFFGSLKAERSYPQVA
jgi:hypothetical protein